MLCFPLFQLPARSMKKFVAEAKSLHERMLAAFQDDEGVLFESKIAALSHSQLDELVVGLRQRAPDAAEAVAYCRMLFATERTREMGLVLCVQLFQGGCFSERAAFRCMPEVRAAIEDSCSVRARAKGGDEHVTALLARICDALIGFLSIDSGVGASSLEGYAQALELLPTVLQCLDNLAIKPNTCVPRGPNARQREAERQESEEANKTSASAVRASVVDSILSSTWPPELVLAIQLVLVEVCLSKEEQARACARIDGDGLQVPEEHVIGLVQSSLAMAEKCGDVRWLDASRRVLEMTPEHMLGDAYCVVEMSLQSGSRLMGLLLQSFASLTSEDKGNLKPQGRAHGASNLQSLSPSFALTVSDFNLMLVVAQNDLFRDIVMDAMTAALRKPVPAQTRWRVLCDASVVSGGGMLGKIVCLQSSKFFFLLELFCFSSLLHFCISLPSCIDVFPFLLA